jgi:hypothetical protein
MPFGFQPPHIRRTHARRCCAVPSSICCACTATQLYQIGAVDHLPRHFDQEAHDPFSLGTARAAMQLWAGLWQTCMHKRPLGRPPFVSTAGRMVQIRPFVERTDTRPRHASMSDVRPVAASLAFGAALPGHFRAADSQLTHVARHVMLQPCQYFLLIMK